MAVETIKNENKTEFYFFHSLFVTVKIHIFFNFRNITFYLFLSIFLAKKDI